MYIIVIRNEVNIPIEGSFPYVLVNYLLDIGKDIIVISIQHQKINDVIVKLTSVKIPIRKEDGEVSWKEYKYQTNK